MGVMVSGTEELHGLGPRPPRLLIAALAWVCVALWLAASFYLSSQREPLGPLSRSPQHATYHGLAHLAGYAGLMLLLTWALDASRRARRPAARPSWRLAALASGLALAWAMLDEYHQGFVPGRVSSPADVGIDLLGVAAAWTVLGWWIRRSGKAGESPEGH